MATKDKIRQVSRYLDSISPTICPAKWLQTTVHLQSGLTHSCHHPPPHKIPLDELQISPGALHLTNHKKKIQKEMLAGKSPKECQYCWNVEDLKQHHVSDRLLKSTEPFSQDFFEIYEKTKSLDSLNYPTYLEVSFSNLCNLKCSYCGPAFSSTWFKEVKKYGGYPTYASYNDLFGRTELERLPYLEVQANPYIDAFWTWLPTVADKLKVLRITGGEPFLSKHTTQLIEWLENQNLSQLELAINSNLCIPQEKLKSFLDKFNNLIKRNKVKKLSFFVSLDSVGTPSEYIRSGLNFNLFDSNLKCILNSDLNTEVTIMALMTNLSFVFFVDFLKYYTNLKSEFSGKLNTLTLDVSTITHPPFLSIAILPDKFSAKSLEIRSFLDINSNFFNQREIEKINRILTSFETKTTSISDDEIQRHRFDFVRFCQEHDKRRGTSFGSTFPTLVEFFEANLKLLNAYETKNNGPFRYPMKKPKADEA